MAVCRSKWSPWYLHPEEYKSDFFAGLILWGIIIIRPDFHGQNNARGACFYSVLVSPEFGSNGSGTTPDLGVFYASLSLCILQYIIREHAFYFKFSWDRWTLMISNTLMSLDRSQQNARRLFMFLKKSDIIDIYIPFKQDIYYMEGRCQSFFSREKRLFLGKKTRNKHELNEQTLALNFRKNNRLNSNEKTSRQNPPNERNQFEFVRGPILSEWHNNRHSTWFAALLALKDDDG